MPTCDHCMATVDVMCSECGNECCNEDCADDCALEDKEARADDEAAEREAAEHEA